MSKYIELLKNGTEYSKKMNMLSRRIFGDVVRETNETSMRVVKRFSEKPYYKIDHIVNYYPRHRETTYLIRKLRSYGLFRDEHEDYKDEMKRLRIARGKLPVKKGEGKQKKRN